MKLYKYRLCGLCLSLQLCQDPCVQSQAMSRLSSDPKYSAGSHIVLTVELCPTVPPGAPDAIGHCEFCRGDGNI